MIDLTLLETSSMSWADKIAYLAYKIAPTGDDNLPLKHRFQNEWYVREITVPANRNFIGRPHINGHICKLVEGRILLITEEGRMDITAPYQIHTAPGYQMVLYTYTDIVGETWHFNPDDLRDVRVLEEREFVPAAVVLRRGQICEYELMEKSKQDYQQVLLEYGVTEAEVTAILNSDVQVMYSKPWPVDVRPSKMQGQGVFVTHDVGAATVIAPMRITGMHTSAGRYTNHSIYPNARAVKHSNGDLYLESTRPIAAHTEVFVDYRQVIKTVQQ